jgi:hypothetical protein
MVNIPIYTKSAILEMYALYRILGGLAEVKSTVQVRPFYLCHPALILSGIHFCEVYLFFYTEKVNAVALILIACATMGNVPQ